MVGITLEKVTKDFVKKNTVTRALEDVDLEIGSGEFFGILGASGSGKTTLMRIIAGLEVPTKGTVKFDETVVSKDGKILVEVEDRNIGMVFQNWALYPHMTNYENIAFPLRAKKLSETEISRRVKEIAELLNITEILPKKPRESSGGQQQRVAFARALVKNPSLLLLDEPFSNLDATIKDVARRYAIEAQRKLGFTAIIVSHDPADIFSLSNRVGVIHRGKILQIGKPIEVFLRPATIEAARATGEYNVLRVDIRDDGNGLVAHAGPNFYVPIGPAPPTNGTLPSRALLGFRPDEVVALPESEEADQVPRGFVECGTATVTISSYSQGSFRVNLYLDNNDSFVCLSNRPFSPGEKVRVFLNTETIHIFDQQTNRVLL